MKINQLSGIALVVTMYLLSSGSKINPNNPPTGKTGAPGENTCMQAGCHSDGTFSGTVTLSGVPDTAIYGNVYPITVTNVSNAVRAGFQLTCLDNSNIKCGNLTSAPGVNIGVGNSRQYARQSQPRNLVNDSISWTFNWTAPLTAAGAKANFYFVSLCANNNGQKTGDNVLVNSKPVVLTSLAAASSPSSEDWLSYYPTQVVSVFQVNLLDGQIGRISIFDSAGRMVLEASLIAENSLDLAQLRAGIYIAKIETPKRRTNKRFVKL